MSTGNVEFFLPSAILRLSAGTNTLATAKGTRFPSPICCNIYSKDLAPVSFSSRLICDFLSSLYWVPKFDRA